MKLKKWPKCFKIINLKILNNEESGQLEETAVSDIFNINIAFGQNKSSWGRCEFVLVSEIQEKK